MSWADIFLWVIAGLCVVLFILGIYSERTERLHEESIEESIERLERWGKLMKKISYDYDAEPMRDEEGSMTRIPTYSPETYFPNYFREKYGLSPIKTSDKKGESSMISRRNSGPSFDCTPCDRVYVRFFNPVLDNNTYHVVGTLECYEKNYDGSGRLIIRLDDGRCMESSFDNVVTMFTLNTRPTEPDRKEKYKEAVLEYKALYDAMKDAGFDDNKAFLLTKTLVAKTLDNKEG